MYPVIVWNGKNVTGNCSEGALAKVCRFAKWLRFWRTPAKSSHLEKVTRFALFAQSAFLRREGEASRCSAELLRKAKGLYYGSAEEGRGGFARREQKRKKREMGGNRWIKTRNQASCVRAGYHEKEEYLAELFPRWIFEICFLLADFCFFSFLEKQAGEYFCWKNQFGCVVEEWHLGEEHVLHVFTRLRF